MGGQVTGKLIYFSGQQGFSNMNLFFSSDEMLSFFFGKLKEEALNIRDNDERNFNLAVILKNEGISFACRKEMRSFGEMELSQLYKDAISYYQNVSTKYLNQPLFLMPGYWE